MVWIPPAFDVGRVEALMGAIEARYAEVMKFLRRDVTVYEAHKLLAANSAVNGPKAVDALEAPLARPAPARRECRTHSRVHAPGSRPSSPRLRRRLRACARRSPRHGTEAGGAGDGAGAGDGRGGGLHDAPPALLEPGRDRAGRYLQHRNVEDGVDSLPPLLLRRLPGAHAQKAQARSSRLRLTDARLRQATGRRTSRYGHPITENVLALALTMMGSRAGRHKIKRRRNEVFAVQF